MQHIMIIPMEVFSLQLFPRLLLIKLVESVAPQIDIGEGKNERFLVARRHAT